ncbi:glycosyltransferase family 4 protein [Arthrobacter roseus]|uniref:glycosyltransferase family 4 protein n=1 Tax=Arthrobacter roseus TaxID=136274 RepID=UPI00196688C0|nr:glycosyltransferase family 4 protein [Arthrobacter roseus]
MLKSHYSSIHVPQTGGFPLRVLLLTHSYAPEHSPPQRRWTQFIHAFRKEGWNVDVVAPIAYRVPHTRILPKDVGGRAFRRDTGEFGERVRRVPVIPHRHSRLGKLMSHLFSAALSVPAALMGPRPDVVVVTVPSLPILGAGYVVSTLCRRPLVVDMRDAWPDLARDARIIKGNAKSLVEKIVTAIQSRSDRVVTVTYGFAQALKDRGIKQVNTVTNGVRLSSIAPLEPPCSETGPLNVLYLGNHGESQKLGLIIRAAALAGDTVKLTMVGHGVNKELLVALAQSLDVDVDFFPPAHGDWLRRFYEQSDTCVVSLRDDWKSFETTIPSKTYEVLSIRRHITAVVLGEARNIIESSGAGDVVAADPAAIADLWRELSEDRTRLNVGDGGRDWVRVNADYESLSLEYIDVLRSVVGQG